MNDLLGYEILFDWLIDLKVLCHIDNNRYEISNVVIKIEQKNWRAEAGMFGKFSSS